MTPLIIGMLGLLAFFTLVFFGSLILHFKNNRK